MRNDEMLAENAALKAEVAGLKQQIAWLMEQLKLSKRRQFGVSSEKSEYDQGSIFNEAESCSDLSVAEPEIEEIKTYRRKNPEPKQIACRRICRSRSSSMSCLFRSRFARIAAKSCM